METKKENIITTLYMKGCIKDECRKICDRPDLLNDLTQDVTVILLSKEEDLIYRLNLEGKILGYVYKTAQYQYNSKTSNFYKTYKQHEQKTNTDRIETL